MFRLEVRHVATDCVWFEYYFTRRAVKELDYLLSEKDENGCPVYEVPEVVQLGFSFDNFKRCWGKDIVLLERG